MKRRGRCEVTTCDSLGRWWICNDVQAQVTRMCEAHMREWAERLTDAGCCAIQATA